MLSAKAISLSNGIVSPEVAMFVGAWYRRNSSPKG